MNADLTNAPLTRGATPSKVLSVSFNGANFRSIGSDAKGVIQNVNVGAERMLGYTAAEGMNQRFAGPAVNATESLRCTKEDQQ